VRPYNESGVEQPVSALLIGGTESEPGILGAIFRQNDWSLAAAQNLGEAADSLAATETHVIIVCADDPRVAWREVLNQAGRSEWRALVIVTSRLADDYLWAEVLNRGGYDVLAQPFEPEEVRRVMVSARNRYQPKPASLKVRCASSAPAA
jgi:DNA-binding response OmpR family regulator